jgi:serine/threonine protein kinase
MQQQKGDPSADPHMVILKDVGPTPGAQVNNGASSDALAASKKDAPKLHLKEFEIMRTLGTGSFGRVHLAKLNSNGIYYAMKALKKSEIVKLRQVEHTLNEKAILEQISMPFTVNLLCTFQDSLHLFIVMEYVSVCLFLRNYTLGR